MGSNFLGGGNVLLCITFMPTDKSPQLQKDSKAEAVAKAAEFLHLGINGKQISAKTKIQVCWHQPPLSWFKLNTDGSSLGDPDLAGRGGLIRNDKGEWVKGFA
nr:putative ribonuclease h protein [Quercus suber]